MRTILSHMIIPALALTLILVSCENKDVNQGAGPNFNEIHEDIHYHFDKTVIDGLEYYILERDRNNPHEGFGFMALDGRDIIKNQDSIKALLKTILEFQVRTTAALQSTDEQEVEEHANELFEYHLLKTQTPEHKKKKPFDE